MGRWLLINNKKTDTEMNDSKHNLLNEQEARLRDISRYAMAITCASLLSYALQITKSFPHDPHPHLSFLILVLLPGLIGGILNAVKYRMVKSRQKFVLGLIEVAMIISLVEMISINKIPQIFELLIVLVSYIVFIYFYFKLLFEHKLI